MSDKPEDKNEKGFAGFNSFADDMSVDVPDMPIEPPVSATKTSEGAQQDDKDDPVLAAYFARKKHALKRKAKENIAWVAVIGVVVLFLIISTFDNKNHHTSGSASTYTSPPAATPYVRPEPTESKPPVGQDNVLNEAQIYYCLAEKTRMGAMQVMINNYVSSEVDSFNSAVGDYNSRCGAFRYRTSDFNSATADINANHATIYKEGSDRVKAWRGISAPAATTRLLSDAEVSTPAPKPLSDAEVFAPTPYNAAIKSDESANASAKFWGQPAKLQGIYHKSHFQNCCLQGVAKDTPYSFLELYKPISVSNTSGGTNENIDGVTVAQLSADQSVLAGIENGDAITASCKSLWQGSTGHYALPVYCNIVSVEKIKSFAPEKNKYQVAQELLNESIEQDSGLLLSRRNAQGDYLSLTGGYEDNSKFIVTLQGIPVLEDTSAAYANFKYFHRIGNEDIVDLETSSGGTACPSEQQLIVIVDGAVTLKKGFGNCSDPEITMPNNQQINFNFYEGYGKRLLAIYKNHDLTEKQIILPPHYDPEGNADGYEYLEKYVPKNDVENILLDSKLNPQLQNLLGGDFTKLTDRLGVFEPHPVSDGYIVISGAIPHSFTSDEGYLAIAVDGSAIYAGVYETEYNTQTKTSISHLSAYSNVPAASTNPPASMYQWLARFQNTSPHWKYLTQ